MKSYTDIEQSKKLAEFLPIESSDMSWASNGLGKPFARTIPLRGHPEEICGCWSLAALLDVIPEGLIENYFVPNIQKENGKYSIAYGDEELLCVADNPVDACYEMIIKLYEQKLL